MTNGKRVKILSERTEVKLAEIAKQLGISPTNLSNKMKRERLSEAELIQIAIICGVKYRSAFIDNEGNVIE